MSMRCKRGICCRWLKSNKERENMLCQHCMDAVNLHSVNSYARNCADPVKAAEDDLLGQALAHMRLMLTDLESGRRDPGTIGIARAILDKAKRR